MKDRGSALLTAVISILILSLISGVFFSMVMSQTKLETSEEKGLVAYYLAEAGVQYGISVVLDGNIKKGDPLPAPETVNDPFGQGGSYKVQWQDNGDEPSFVVTSTGTYSGVIRKKAAEYTYADDSVDEEPLPDYPLWSPSQSYPIANTYVIYNGKVFFNWYYASEGQTPGTLYNPWQEVTDQWRNFNRYYKDDIVFYNSRKFKAMWYTQNQEPGLLYGPWQEITE